MHRAWIPVVGLCLIGASGIADGMKTGRWSDNDHLARAAASLDRVPNEVGGWIAEPLTIDPDQLKAAEAAGGYAARYHHSGPDGQATVETMILCGPFGPIAVHPPTVCFRGIGYRQVREVSRVTVKNEAGKTIGTLWSTEFERSVDGLPERLRTWWGWTNSGVWSAPSSPRFEFAGSDSLFKLYITEKVDADGGKESRIPEFASQFIPGLQETVFSES